MSLPSALISSSSTRSGDCFSVTTMCIGGPSLWPSPQGERGIRAGLIHQLDDVADDELSFVAGRLHGVLEARDLERAADREHVGADFHRLADASLRQALFEMRRIEPVEPHAAASAAAAVAVRLAAEHLDDLDSRNRPQHLARRFVLAVVTTEVAGVVERDLRAYLVLPLELRHQRSE